MLFLIFLAVLLTANEIRFQGCVQRIDTVRATNAAHPGAGLLPPECSRLPFGG